MEGQKPPCNRSVCAATKLGVLVLSLKAAGFVPCPTSTDTLRRSILSYWKDFKDLGATHKPYQPCNGLYYSRNVPHPSSCSFEACFGDFGIIKAAQAALKRNTNGALWQEWEKVRLNNVTIEPAEA